MQHRDGGSETCQEKPESADKKTGSGCYGIDNLFAKKSRKLSFKEFCDGIKDIFLAIPILLFKLIAMVFNFVKRPICAFAIFCVVILFAIVHVFRGGSSAEKNVVVVRNVSSINAPVVKSKPRIISDIDEHIAVITGENAAAVARENRTKSARLFENKLREFFAENPVSDVTRSNGRCRIRLRSGVFAEHSTMCNNPKIILESSTDDEIVFSDGAGNLCALPIESLLH
jgi:hypothetical protein